MEPEELPVESLCRTCLCPVEDSLDSNEELELVNFVEMLNQTFGKIVGTEINSEKINKLIVIFIAGSFFGEFAKQNLFRMPGNYQKSS